MKTLTSGCENVPAWCTWMTYPICWGHSWWSYPYLLVLYGIRLTQEPACRHLFISWPCSIEKSRFFSFKQPDIQMSTDKLGLFNSVWPSDAFNLPWGNLIRLCIHDKKPSFMTSQVCVCVLKILAGVTRGMLKNQCSRKIKAVVIADRCNLVFRHLALFWHPGHACRA